MAQAQMGLDHHGGVVVELGIGFELFGLGCGLGREGDSVGPVDLFGDQLDALPERGFQLVEEFEVDFVLTGVNDRIRELEGSLAAIDTDRQDTGPSSPPDPKDES